MRIESGVTFYAETWDVWTYEDVTTKEVCISQQRVHTQIRNVRDLKKFLKSLSQQKYTYKITLTKKVSYKDVSKKSFSGADFYDTISFIYSPCIVRKKDVYSVLSSVFDTNNLSGAENFKIEQHNDLDADTPVYIDGIYSQNKTIHYEPLNLQSIVLDSKLHMLIPNKKIYKIIPWLATYWDIYKFLAKPWEPVHHNVR